MGCDSCVFYRHWLIYWISVLLLRLQKVKRSIPLPWPKTYFLLRYKNIYLAYHDHSVEEHEYICPHTNSFQSREVKRIGQPTTHCTPYQSICLSIYAKEITRVPQHFIDKLLPTLLGKLLYPHRKKGTLHWAQTSSIRNMTARPGLPTFSSLHWPDQEMPPPVPSSKTKWKNKIIYKSGRAMRCGSLNWQRKPTFMKSISIF